MGNIIEKVIAAVLVIVFITFLINHGKIDFSGVDAAKTIIKDSVNSDEGQEIVQEFKDIGNQVVSDLATGTLDLIKGSTKKNERLEAKLVSVVDGDTLVVNLEGTDVKVRLIGIDTPESVNPDESKNNIYGEMASAHTKELLNGVDKVYLQFDEEYEDDYERLLAYVWYTKKCDDTTESIKENMLNGQILRDGYANVMKIAPNTKYAYSFSLIKKDAVNNSTGLWSQTEFADLW